MKNQSLVVWVLTFLWAFNSPLTTAHAQSTAFTYQGRLNDGGGTANGIYDLQFTILDAATNGVAQAGPLTNALTSVSNGLFTVTLDFGAGVFSGPDRWLEIGARTNGGGAYATLSPRQQLTSTPYAVQAVKAGTANTASSVNAANIVGTIPLGQLPSQVVTNGATGVSISGTFSGNGAGVTNVNLLTANSGGAISWSPVFVQGTFVLASTNSVGGSPSAVAAADVNGDSKVDLISANFAPATVSILTNNGSGAFVLASSASTVFQPLAITAADVNGDGKVDLITASGGGTLTVLTNNGSGSFVLSSTPAVGAFPYSVAAADVNGDGKLDLISANYNGNTLSVLTNNGSGAFVLSSSPGTGSNPRSVAAADVNGDGKVDLISANALSDSLTVLTNNGSGGFVLASTPAVGTGPRSVVAVDVNGDGKADLISANVVADSLTVLTNNGSGGFVLASSPAVGDGPVWVTAADVNSDGRLDLITANSIDQTLSVMTNNGSGGFALASSPGAGNSVQGLVAADANGDGGMDLISVNQSDSTLRVLLNAGSFRGNFIGNGAGLTGLNASNLTSGTIADARLSANVALLNTNQTFTGLNTFNQKVTVTTNGQELFFTDLGQVRSFDNNHRILFRRAENTLELREFGDIVFSPGAVAGTETAKVVMRANGNVGIGTNNPQAALQVIGNILASGTVTGSSDRNVKENFAPVDARAVLEKVAALPISRWNYKADEEVTHLGPMAQDFYSAFTVGMDDKHISMVDADGVALAAIQGLNQKLSGELARKEAEITELKRRLEKLERLMSEKNGGAQ